MRGKDDRMKNRIFAAVLLASLAVLAPGCGFIGIIPLAAGVGIGLASGGDDKEEIGPEPTNPIVSGISPASGTTNGSTTVEVYGRRFKTGATVSFGGADAVTVSVSDTLITCTTISSTAGVVDVVVENLDGQTATLAGAFTYDGTPPAAITDFSVTVAGYDLALTWTNPTDADFDCVVIRRDTAGSPATPQDGTLAYSGTAESHTDTGLQGGRSYYYSIFARDVAGNYSSSDTGSAYLNSPPVVEALQPIFNRQAPAGWVVFTALVTDSDGSITSVTIDLTPVGGTSALTMLDDGAVPDAAAGDDVYTYGYQLPPLTATGSYNITISGYDDDAIGTQDTSSLTVDRLLLDLPNARVDSPSVTADSKNVRLASSGNRIYAVWEDYRNGAADIYFNCSTDGGKTWPSGSEVKIDSEWNSTTSSVNPAIACSGQNVYIAWQDDRNGDWDIFAKFSTNGGASWQAEPRLDAAPAGADAINPQIACNGEAVCVVWLDLRMIQDIRSNRTINAGQWWSGEQTVTTGGAGFPYSPQIAFSGSHVYVTWHQGAGSDHDIYVATSNDWGTSWGSPARVDCDSGSADSTDPCIAVSGNFALVAWSDDRNGSYDVYFNSSSDWGASFGSTAVRLDTDTAGSADSFSPRIDASGLAVYVVWKDLRDGAGDVRANVSQDAGANWLATDLRMDTDAAGLCDSDSIRVSASGSNAYVAWRDFRSGSMADIYLNYSADWGVTWQPGDIRLDSDAPGRSISASPSIACTGNDLCVAWEDKRNGVWDIFSERGKHLWTGSAGSSDVRVDQALTGTQSFSPEITCWGRNVYAVWEDDRGGGGTRIFFNRSTNGGATWMSSDVRLDSSSNTCYEQRIACSGECVYAVWLDLSAAPSPRGIMFNRSTDGGATWGTSFPISTGPGTVNNPDIACCGNLVCVVWEDNSSGTSYDVYCSYSLDAGASWQPNLRIDAAPGPSGVSKPKVACSGPRAWAVWVDNRNVTDSIYVNYADIGLLSPWGAATETRLDNNLPPPSTLKLANPSIAAFGTSVSVSWLQEIALGNNHVFFTRSNAAGVLGSWLIPAFAIDNTAANCSSSNLACWGDVVLSAWVQKATGPGTYANVHLNRSGDWGGTWPATSTPIETNASDSSDAQIRCYGSNVFVAWADKRSGADDVYARISTDSGSSWPAAEFRLDTDTAGAAASYGVRIATWGNALYSVWRDMRNGNPDIFFNSVK